MPEQIFDAALEGSGRGWATGAGAAHVEEHLTVAETLEGDVAAIHGDGRANAGRDQFLDDLDGFAIGRVEELLTGHFRRLARIDNRLAGEEMLHDDAEDRGLDV